MVWHQHRLKLKGRTASQRVMAPPSGPLTPAEGLATHCGFKDHKETLKRNWTNKVMVLLPGYGPVETAAVFKGLHTRAQKQLQQ